MAIVSARADTLNIERRSARSTRGDTRRLVPKLRLGTHLSAKLRFDSVLCLRPLNSSRQFFSI